MFYSLFSHCPCSGPSIKVKLTDMSRWLARYQAGTPGYMEPIEIPGQYTGGEWFVLMGYVISERMEYVSSV